MNDNILSTSGKAFLKFISHLGLVQFKVTNEVCRDITIPADERGKTCK